MIGLSPNSQDGDAELFTTGLGVDKFTVNLADHRVMFGENDPSIPRFGTVWHNLEENSQYWRVPLNSVKYGATEVKSAATKHAFFDTGTSLNMAPTADL